MAGLSRSLALNFKMQTRLQDKNRKNLAEILAVNLEMENVFQSLVLK